MISELSINEFHRTLNEMTVEGTPSYKGSFFAFFTINFSNKPFYGYVSKSEFDEFTEKVIVLRKQLRKLIDKLK